MVQLIMLTIERIKIIRKVTRRLYFAYTGCNDGWEDAAQHICMKHLEGVGLQQDLKHALIDYLRSHYYLRNKLMAPLPDSLAAEFRFSEVKTVEQLVTVLPEMQRRVLILYFKEELTLKEIGKALGFTESRASQILKQSTKALYRLFTRP
jgi:RNA polymerase sigma factor (sigma-70 family)